MVCYQQTIQHIMNMKKADATAATIREHARKVAKKHGLLSGCAKCGYTTHVVACHRNPVAGFPGETLISVINDPGNLIGLCARCHWELDHGLLRIEDVAVGSSAHSDAQVTQPR